MTKVKKKKAPVTTPSKAQEPVLVEPVMETVTVAMVIEARDFAEEATERFEHELAIRSFVPRDEFYLAEEAEQVAREEQSWIAERAANVLLASEPYEQRKS